MKITFHDLDGILIKEIRSDDGGLKFYSWIGEKWVSYYDIAKLNFSDCRISDEKAGQMLREIAYRYTNYIHTDDQVRDLLYRQESK